MDESSLFIPTMRPLMNFTQLTVGDVSVNLSGSNIFVAEKFLNRPQIRPSLKQIGGK